MFSPGEHILLVPADEGSVYPVYVREWEKAGCTVSWALTPENADFFRALFPEHSFYMLPSAGEKFSTFWPPGLFSRMQAIKISRGRKRQSQEISRLVRVHGCTSVAVEARKLAVEGDVRKILVLSRPGKGAYYSSHPPEFRVGRAYDEIWLPDTAGQHRALGEGFLPPGTVPMEIPAFTAATEPDMEFLVVLSGHEPYRTVLERQVWGNLLWFNRPVTVIRNTLLPPPGLDYGAHYTLYSFAAYDQWISLLSGARYVICRPDPGIILLLMRMGKQAILVPGNARKTEQELAGYHRDYRNFFVEDLHDLDVGRALSKMKYYRPVELYPGDPGNQA